MLIKVFKFAVWSVIVMALVPFFVLATLLTVLVSLWGGLPLTSAGGPGSFKALQAHPRPAPPRGPGFVTPVQADR